MPTLSMRRIAILTPDVSIPSGVTTVVRFLLGVLALSGRYETHVVSVATSSRDEASVRLFAPRTWGDGVRCRSRRVDGISHDHVGALGSEVEVLRYFPHRHLTRLLNRSDLVQVVGGTPAWGYLARDFEGPVALQMASLSALERAPALRRAGRARRLGMSLMTLLNGWIERAALRRADVVFVENRRMRDAIARRRGAGRTVLAPPGVDTTRFAPDAYRAEGYWLGVGRFADPRKNVRLLLRAYGQARHRGDLPRLVLAGYTMPAPEDLALARDLGILDRIECRVNPSPDALVGLYRGAALFLTSSDEEGFGLALLEAMACGLPVLATRSGGPEDVVVDGVTGVLTPAGDAGAFAARLGDLHASPALRARLGEAGRRRVVDHFGSGQAGRRFLLVYEMLLGSSRPLAPVPT